LYAIVDSKMRVNSTISISTLLFAIVSVLPIEAESETITSAATRVIDGDTLTLNSIRIRLHGIDAPETNQSCNRGNNTSWRCGTASTKTLKELIENFEVTCVKRDVDRYGRIVAVCSANGINLNARMVSLGMAVAYRKYSKDYVGQEASANAARRGMWSGEFVMPWDWRRGKRSTSKTAANNTNSPTGCQIKGNISSKGERIYHTPGSRWYAKTVVSVDKGERWFCTEVEAKGAGWRTARP
jgi:endonuclease YncB( thermonuclease family)